MKKFRWGDYLFGAMVIAILHKMNPAWVVPTWQLICVGVIVVCCWIFDGRKSR